MEEKNLFDYATKELSQDAFLRWLLESINDPVVGIASKKLLSEMAKLYQDQPLDVDKITSVKTWAQYKKMDIVADVYIGKEKAATFIIEDKTESHEHNQLAEYDKHIDGWTGQKYKYRIFYKTERIDPDERKRINEKWRIMDIDAIASIFDEFADSDNLILRSYALHVASILKELTAVPDTSDVDRWNFRQVTTYLQRCVLNDTALSKYQGSIKCTIGSYLGRYVSLMIYYKLGNEMYIDPKRPSDPDNFWDANLCYPIVEFIFREDSENVIVYTHASYKFYSKENERKQDWTWKSRSSELSNELYVKFRPEIISNNLKELLQAGGIKCRGMHSYKAQTISSQKIKKGDIVKAGAWAKEIARYLEIFSKLDKTQE